MKAHRSKPKAKLGPISPRERLRRKGYGLLARGVRKAEIARQLHVAWQRVWEWEKRRKKLGPQSWRDIPQPGRPPKLVPKQRTRLEVILAKGAQAYGYPTELWTLKRVVQVLRKEWGVRYTPSGVWRMLRRMGFSSQVPMTLALERDVKGIRRWVRKVWPGIMEHAHRTKATVVFVDESGKQTTPNVRKSWAKKGETPVLRCSGSRKRLNIVGGVTLKGELHFATHRDNMGGTEAMWFLEQLLEDIRGKVLVIWDNGSIHKAPEVRTFAWLNRQRLELWRFPPYAPEYDPQETVWDVLKNDMMGNYCATDLDDLEETVTRNLRWLKRRPDVIRTAMRQSKLPLPEIAGGEAIAATA
ncbi:ISXoo2 transposase [mine drainage metagenome]|uniref:ISXoo2 transposase n=1 Tax=mine drainage metagenome TaxID=410659 RepID=T1BN68_9ZZZZ